MKPSLARIAPAVVALAAAAVIAAVVAEDSVVAVAAHVTRARLDHA